MKEKNPGKALVEKRWEKTTPEQRKEATRKATQARWPKKVIPIQKDK